MQLNAAIAISATNCKNKCISTCIDFKLSFLFDICEFVYTECCYIDKVDKADIDLEPVYRI